MDWREVIHRYLSACVEDSRQARPPLSRLHFIDELGTTALKSREAQNRTRLENKMASQKVLLPETFKEIEGSPTRIVAEVEKANVFELFFTTRFLLIMEDDQWKLEDILWKCSCENGMCISCKGR
jgi:hypothetical protein